MKNFIMLAGIALTITAAEILQNFMTGTNNNISEVGYGLLSNTLTVMVLGLFAINSYQRGFKLSLSIWIIYFGIFVTMMVDTAMMSHEFSDLVMHTLPTAFVTSIILAPGIVYLLGKWKNNEEPVEEPQNSRSVNGWIWRIILADLLYFIIAGIAGIILFASITGIDEFYKDKLPPIATMLLVQSLFRVPILIFISIIVITGLKLSTAKKSIIAGLTLSILLGIAPLIRPSEIIPDNIRYGHIVEAGISLFLYGLVLGYLLNIRSKGNETSVVNMGSENMRASNIK